jgi:hypothetical protein
MRGVCPTLTPMSVQGVSTQVAVAAAISHAHPHFANATAAANKRTSWRGASKPAFYAAFYATADEATGGIFE